MDDTFDAFNNLKERSYVLNLLQKDRILVEVCFRLLCPNNFLFISCFTKSLYPRVQHVDFGESSTVRRRFDMARAVGNKRDIHV